MRKKSRSPLENEALEEPLINLTPLIDVVFVVLITFMLIAPILNIDSVNLASGNTSATQASESSPLSISVRADNSIWFQGKRVTLSELENLLKGEKKKHPKAIPQIHHDIQAQFGTYQSLKNTLEKVGFEQMDIVLKPN